MRTEKAIGKNVLIHYDSENNVFFVRERGKNKPAAQLLKVCNDQIVISKEVIDKYGIEIKIQEEELT